MRRALALAGLAAEAGLPEGVLNVVAGDKEAIGAEMLASPVIRKCAGRRPYSPYPKPLTMRVELPSSAT